MAKPLFGKHIAPACEYCANGRLTTDQSMILCSRKGVVEKYHKCRRFQYDPLLRKPQTAPNLPKYSDKDFSLDEDE